MTDRDETANLVFGITEAYRAHAAEEATERPLTYDQAAGGSIVDQIARYRELADHDVMARSIATLKARGTYQPNEHVNEEKFPPLTAAGHLEMLALGERIARYYRHPSQVDQAVKAGATWDQIAAATGTRAEEARTAYREWAEGQHKYASMSDDEYAAAIKAAGDTGSAQSPLSAELNARRAAAAAVLDDYKATLASAPLSSPPGREWMLRLASALEDVLAAPEGGQP
jgi:hypothetical protein